MPWALTSTVAPTDEFLAILTTAPPCWLDKVLAGEVPELLPHAANVSDTANAGIRNLRTERIGSPI
jgi:hypothetical protein